MQQGCCPLIRAVSASGIEPDDLIGCSDRTSGNEPGADMSTITTSTLSGFSSPEYRSLTRGVRSFDQTSVKASVALIIGLLDLVVVLWVFPFAQQLAEWAGVNFLYAIYIGAAAMGLSIPIVVVANILLLRRIMR